MCYDRYIVMWLLQEPNKEIMYPLRYVFPRFTRVGLPVVIGFSYGRVKLDCWKHRFQLRERALKKSMNISVATTNTNITIYSFMYSISAALTFVYQNNSCHALRAHLHDRRHSNIYPIRTSLSSHLLSCRCRCQMMDD